MTPEPAQSGFSLSSLFQLIDTKGLALVIAVIAIVSVVAFGPKVYAKIETILENSQTLLRQHGELGPKIQESTRIQCATCWNAATDSEEIKRCGCNPKSQ